MEEKTFTITSNYGLHARAASILVQQAAKFDSKFEFRVPVRDTIQTIHYNCMNKFGNSSRVTFG